MFTVDSICITTDEKISDSLDQDSPHYMQSFNNENPAQDSPNRIAPQKQLTEEKNPPVFQNSPPSIARKK